MLLAHHLRRCVGPSLLPSSITVTTIQANRRFLTPRSTPISTTTRQLKRGATRRNALASTHCNLSYNRSSIHTRSSLSATGASPSPSSSSESPHFILPPILFVTGGPGAGKGTQCTLLTQAYGADVRGEDGNEPAVANVRDSSRPSSFGVAHISVGAVLRRAINSIHDQSPSSSSSNFTLSSADRDLILSTLARGGILPGRLTVQLVRQELARLVHEQATINPTKRLCCVIDGFPRTMDNVNEFERQCGRIDSVLLLDCDPEQMIARLGQRGRSDDKVDVIQRRIEGFNKETMPVVEWFKGEVQAYEANGDKSNSVLPTASSSSPANVNTPFIPHFYVIDGRPSIETVWKEVRQVFKQFALARMAIDIDQQAR